MFKTYIPNSTIRYRLSMPNYTKHKKQFLPVTVDTFIEGMNNGKFCQLKHRGFCAGLFYYGVRVSELLNAVKEQFFVRQDRIYFDVGPRLKGGLHTAPLFVPVERPFAHTILDAVDHTQKTKRVWPYCRATAWNIVDRVFTYPHHFRLSKITTLLQKGFSIIEVKNWTGHKSLSSLDFYAGTVDIEKLGAA